MAMKNIDEGGPVDRVVTVGEFDKSVRESYRKPEKEKIRGGLSGVELSEDSKKSCKGHISDESGAITEVEFDYFHSELNALDFELSENEKSYLNESLALQDLKFHIYSREWGGDGSIEDRPEKKVYVLLHGWTATHAIYSDVIRHNNLTMVEEILARDPSAIIVVPDGNGFGESRFKKQFERPEIDMYRESTHNEKMTLIEAQRMIISDKSTPEYYAMQMEFLIGVVLDLEGAYNEKLEKVRGSDRVAVLGHSMGGSAAMVMAVKWGYQHCLASAPALFPTKRNEEYMESHQDLLRENKAAERLYRFLGNSIDLAFHVERLKGFMSSLSEFTVKQVFYAIGKELMGRKISGDPEKDKIMLQHLGAIHVDELTTDKLLTASTTILNLINGIDFSKWSMQEIANLENVEIISGKFDTLVPWEELMFTLTTISAYALDAQSEGVPGSDEAADAAVKLVQRVIIPGLVKGEVYKKEDDSGHYRALLGDETVTRKLVAMVHENKGEEK